MQTVTFTIETDSESQIEAVKEFLKSLKNSRVTIKASYQKKHTANSIAQSNSFEVPAEHQEQVLQRLESMKNDPSSMIDWAEAHKLINE